VYDEVVERLKNAYSQLKIGDPLEEGTIYGPLHSQNSVDLFLKAIEAIKSQNGNIVYGGKVYFVIFFIKKF
jgi:aldehyde dehydrogenase family 7 protein A1